MAEKKTMFHSELVQLGAVKVLVKTDVMHSKFKGKLDYVVLECEGVERNLNLENAACAEAMNGLKGKIVVLEAKGRANDAEIMIAGATTTAEEREAAAEATQQRKPAVPAPTNTAAPSKPSPKPGHEPVYGATVGMAVKEACTVASGIGIDPTKPEYFKFVYEFASDIVRVSLMIEKGELAPSAKTRQASAAK